MAQTLPKWVPNRLQIYWDMRRWTDAHGWANTAPDCVTPEQRRKGLAATWNEYRPAVTGFTLGGPNCAALDDVLALCRSEGLAVAILLMPEGRDFRGWHADDTLHQVDMFLARLHREFGVQVIDARTWVPDEYFSDGHHLLKSGARQFTDRLANEHLLPRLRGRAEKAHAAR